MRILSILLFLVLFLLPSEGLAERIHVYHHYGRVGTVHHGGHFLSTSPRGSTSNFRKHMGSFQGGDLRNVSCYYDKDGDLFYAKKDDCPEQFSEF
jgi:hypothetical protein